MRILKEKPFVIVDVETTGASPVRDRVIEIGLLRVEGGEVVETFSSLVDPETALPSSIERITGISAEMLVGAPTFEDIRHRVEELLEGAIFVAHNARFDYAFVKNELKRSGLAYSAKCLCTVRLSRKLFPSERHHDLTTLIERFGLRCPSRHRAFDDAQVLWQLLLWLKAEDEVGADEAIRELLREHTLPQFLDERSVRALPEGPGVYLFYGAEDELLYIGKSKNVRTRVLSHFAGDSASTKELHLCQQTTRIEAQPTKGELGALLLESRLIKEYLPIYNRQLRRRSDMVCVRLIEGEYPAAAIERIRTLPQGEEASILGIFRSERQAKDFLRSVADEYGLCPKLLGLEKPGVKSSACWSRQLDACSGACVGAVDHKEYRKAFLAAFKARRLRSWPYGGPVILEERLDDEESHAFVFDHWRLVATIESTPDDTRIEEYHPDFDYDAYKIFARFLKDPANRRRIKPVGRKELDRALVYSS